MIQEPPSKFLPILSGIHRPRSAAHMSCITAQTIVRHDVTPREGVNSISALAMHHLGKGIKGKPVLFIFTQTAHLIADSASGICRVLAAKWVRASPKVGAFQIPARSAATSFCSRWGMAFMTFLCLWTTQRCRNVAGKSEVRAASKPSCPSVTTKSICATPRVRRSWRRQLQLSLLSSAHARNARTSRLPSKSHEMRNELAASRRKRKENFSQGKEMEERRMAVNRLRSIYGVWGVEGIRGKQANKQ